MNNAHKNTRKTNFLRGVEVFIHLFLLIGVPVLYLYFQTEFSQYTMPDYSTDVYLYWLIYPIVSAMVYGVLNKKKKKKKNNNK